MGEIRPGEFDGIVQRFYEAAARPELWPDALHRFAETCGSSGGNFNAMMGGQPAGCIASKALEEVVRHGTETGWYAAERNSRMQRGIALYAKGHRGIVTENDAYDPADFARDPYQQEFIEPHGFRSYAGAIVAQGANYVVPLVLERRIHEGAFQRSDIALLTDLYGRLASAVTLAVRVGLSSASRLADSLSEEGEPTAILGADGRVLNLSARFAALVGDGLMVQGGRLASWHPKAQEALDATVSRALASHRTLEGAGGPVVLPRREGLPIVMRFVPLVRSALDLLQFARVMVVATDLGASRASASAETLATAFGLTPGESRLAAHLAAGRTLQEIAPLEGVAYETLRGRLKILFDKTGTSRQTDLALLLMSVPSGTSR